MKIRIYYEDTDAGGVVYHTNYIKFCERARSELFFSKNLSPQKNNNEFFVVKKIECDFIKPAVLGDIIEVKTTLVKRKFTSLLLQQDIYRDDVLLFKASILAVYVKDLKPFRIPDDMYEVLA
ncbi:MAG: YbgC/FadM family acyl-CoA thioesterase [Campylobacteraceae bacterium]|nr:YbgC/FadM family acyl-CoA thioesterase [Campylobacteraceae bacterium]